MNRTLVLIVGLFWLGACEPGRCLRHSDCPGEATCSSGVCRLPPKQSKSKAEPGKGSNQATARTESVIQSDDSSERADASLGVGSPSAGTVTATTDDTVIDGGATAIADANVSRPSLDGSALDAVVDAHVGDAYVGDGSLWAVDAAP